MKKQTISILTILAVGSFFGVAYSASTIISDTGITTSNLTVTGTCTGCGAGEGDFTNWTLTTDSSATRLGGVIPASIVVDNNGTTVVKGLDYKAIVIARNGTTILLDNTTPGFGNGAISLIGQSIDGKYQFVNLQSNGHLEIYKSGVLIKDITLDFATKFVDKTEIVTGMSPDGKYLIVYGASNVGGEDRIQVYQGS